MDKRWKIGFKTTNYGTGQHQDDVGDRSRHTIGGFGLNGRKLMFKKKILEVLYDREECDQVWTAEH